MVFASDSETSPACHSRVKNFIMWTVLGASAIAVGRPVARTAPAQIPACPFRAPGSSEVLVSASGVTKEKEATLQSRTGPNGDSWTWHMEIVEQILEALPRKTVVS